MRAKFLGDGFARVLPVLEIVDDQADTCRFAFIYRSLTNCGVRACALSNVPTTLKPAHCKKSACRAEAITLTAATLALASRALISVS